MNIPNDLKIGRVIRDDVFYDSTEFYSDTIKITEVVPWRVEKRAKFDALNDFKQGNSWLNVPNESKIGYL